MAFQENGSFIQCGSYINVYICLRYCPLWLTVIALWIMVLLVLLSAGFSLAPVVALQGGAVAPGSAVSWEGLGLPSLGYPLFFPLALHGGLFGFACLLPFACSCVAL
ncbi:unnamed protein product [Ilex paraguariensis]|uniref:Uncharacterized protein n=1 Tax=Ilex paraguariensis TaxID=185542 RepID=A0ABC8T3A6_9AQUA